MQNTPANSPAQAGANFGGRPSVAEPGMTLRSGLVLDADNDVLVATMLVDATRNFARDLVASATARTSGAAGAAVSGAEVSAALSTMMPLRVNGFKSCAHARREAIAAATAGAHS